LDGRGLPECPCPEGGEFFPKIREKKLDISLGVVSLTTVSHEATPLFSDSCRLDLRLAETIAHCDGCLMKWGDQQTKS
jgi:hypothetical protein